MYQGEQADFGTSKKAQVLRTVDYGRQMKVKTRTEMARSVLVNLERY